ncbi:MAG: hypothetical protein H0T62_11445 [Parachlamydiaceae bacterium]|nr:hypothetical protein [Parachlamydiaceae bacterium]
MEKSFPYILGHIPLILMGLAIILYMFKWTAEALCRYMLLLPIGIGSLWNFAFHTFAPEYAAHFIGWQSSPFQYEVAAANLGLGLAGIVAFRKNWDVALAVTVMAFFFLMGKAYAHLLEMFFAADYTSGNIGAILHAELLIPLLLALSLCLWKRDGHRN